MADRTKYNEYVAKLKEKLIIDIEQIQAASMLDLNINEDKLIYACVNAQSIFLEPLIGSAMVRKLQTKDLTFEYELLLERFLNDAIINWGVSESIQGLAYQIAQGGIFKHTASDSELPTPKEIATIRQTYLYRADLFGKRLVDFLNKNKSYYPEYDQNTADGLNSSKYQQFTGGLQIERQYSSCGGGVGNTDAELFVANTYWGNSNESDIEFDYTTLSDMDNTVPNSVMAQPIADYFWVVSDVELNLSQVGMIIPTTPFEDVDPLTTIFVKGEYNGMYYLRIKITDTYEQAVQFALVLA